jgi:hypothetical protein
MLVFIPVLLFVVMIFVEDILFPSSPPPQGLDPFEEGSL